MIVYDLSCESGHRFEGWFSSSEDFARQSDRGLVACPNCGSQSVAKAPMAPAVGRKGNQQLIEAPATRSPEPADADRQAVSNRPMPPEVVKALQKLADAQAKALKQSTWVGNDFAEASRKMHYGERNVEPIHGQASIEEAESLLEEGIQVAPLPFPVAPPDELN